METTSAISTSFRGFAGAVTSFLRRRSSRRRGRAPRSTLPRAGCTPPTPRRPEHLRQRPGNPARRSAAVARGTDTPQRQETAVSDGVLSVVRRRRALSGSAKPSSAAARLVVSRSTAMIVVVLVQAGATMSVGVGIVSSVYRRHNRLGLTSASESWGRVHLVLPASFARVSFVAGAETPCGQAHDHLTTGHAAVRAARSQSRPRQFSRAPAGRFDECCAAGPPASRSD
jgi:hypothetical protein